MKSATDVLRDEHVLILRSLTLLEIAVDQLAAGAPVGEAWWGELMAWLRGFADRNHHAKEERLLFPAMVKAGVPGEPGGPIGVMLEEHTEGRALVRLMAEGEPADRGPAARRYIGLLRAHIDKEDSVLFPLGEATLDPSVQRELARDFEAVGAELGRQASLDDADAALRGLAGALDTSARGLAS